MTMSDKIRCLIFTDESRIWNMDMANNKRLSYMIGYIYYKNHIVNMLNIRGTSRNLAVMTSHEKNTFLRVLTKYFHQLSSEENIFYSYFNKDKTVLYHALNDIMVYYNRQIQRLFVLKFYHERKSKNFLKTLKFIGEWDKIDKVGFSEFPNEFDRKLREYQKDPNHDRTISLKTSAVNWPMPDTYFKSIGPTLRGFSFLFANNNKISSDNLAPINELINLESGTEEIYNVLSPEIFFPEEKEIRKKITV